MTDLDNNLGQGFAQALADAARQQETERDKMRSLIVKQYYNGDFQAYLRWKSNKFAHNGLNADWAELQWLHAVTQPHPPSFDETYPG